MPRLPLFLFVLSCFPPMALPAAEPLLFPKDAGLVDVRDYGVVPNSGKDETAGIQEAFDQNSGSGSVIYLPPGEYRISDTIKWPGRRSFNMLQGAGIGHTVLRLVDNAPGFDNPKKPKNMIWTGGPPAQRFKNAVRDLTIDCGGGNPGAVGLNFCANNQGTVRDVVIRSGVDGGQPGAIGLALDEPEVGPLLVKNVTVVGFDIGVRVRHSVNSVTLEHLVLRGQREAGIDNYNNYVFLRKLDFEGDVPAVNNAGPDAVFTLVDSRIAGTGGAAEKTALFNRNARGMLYVRGVEVSGFATAIESEGNGPVGPGPIAEWVSNVPVRLFPGELRSLGLPVRETPTVPHDPLEQWASPIHFGGRPDDGEDDTAAIQRAIDSGATTVYLPRAKEKRNPNDPGRKGAYFISDTIHIRGNVRRIVGLEASMEVTNALADQPDKPVFVFENGAHPAVVLERLRFTFKRFPNPAIVHTADRDLVISSFSELHNPVHRGKGALFLEDTVGPAIRVGPGSALYARQLNIEGGDMKLINDGGLVWALGLKTECRGSIALTKAGGQTEIIGGHLYKCVKQGVENVAFTVEAGGRMSLAGVAEYVWDPQYATLPIVEETRDGETRLLTKHDFPTHANAVLIPLLSCFPTPVDGIPPSPPVVTVENTTESEIELSFAPRDTEEGIEGYIVHGEEEPLGRTRGRFRHRGLAPETEYLYTVSAYDRFGQVSAPEQIRVGTTADTTPPSTPDHLRTMNVTDRMVHLAWRDSRDEIGVKGYRLERRGADGVLVRSLGQTEFVDEQVEKGSSYEYRIGALDAAGNESDPAVLNVEVPAHPPRRIQQEAERYADSYGSVKKGWFLFNLHGGCWMKYPDIELGRETPFNRISIRYGAPKDRAGSVIVVLVDPEVEEVNGKRRLRGGTEAARFEVESTGGWEDFQTFTQPLTLERAGEHDVYLLIERGTSKHPNALVNIDWFETGYME